MSLENLIAHADAVLKRIAKFFQPRPWTLTLCTALLLLWPAIINRQPFYFTDTIAYIYGGESIGAKVFKQKKDFLGVVAKPEKAAAQTAPAPSAATATSSKADPGKADNDVQRGTSRSVYYGFLTDITAHFGGFWPVIFLQALAGAWLLILTLRALALPTESSILIAGVVSLASPLPVFADLIMPDIWAGYAIIGGCLLFTAGDRLNRLEMLIAITIIAFACLCHMTILLDVAAILALGLALWAWSLWTSRRPQAATSSGAGASIAGLSYRLGVLGCIAGLLVGLAGLAVVGQAIKKMYGSAPVNQPFLTARVIADGPGLRYIRNDCAGKSFAVCRYKGGPISDAEDFLYSMDPALGGWLITPPSVRRIESSEDFAFAASVFARYPVSQTLASLRNFGAEFVDMNVDVLNYPKNHRDFFDERATKREHSIMVQTPAYREAWPAHVLEAFNDIVLLAFAGAAIWLATRSGKPAPRALLFFAFITWALIFNAGACGVLSGVYGRYQARASWTLLVAAAAVIATAGPVRRFLPRSAAA